MLVLIDNYDSFTYNLVQAVTPLISPVRVLRNDKTTVAEVRDLRPSAVLLSPGPGAPAQAGICIELIRALAPVVPMLGVCLGHQAITEAFGGRVVRAHDIVHGKSSAVFHNRQGIFRGLPLPFSAGRYHSLVADRATLPRELMVQAETPDGTVMAVKHVTHPCYGVQFHPESILTPDGPKLLKNFFDLALKKTPQPKVAAC